MSKKIFLGARGTTERSHDLSADNISTQDKGPGSMPKIFKFAPFDFSRAQGQPCMLALQGLDSRQFIGTHGTFSLFGSLGSLLIHLAGRHNGFLSLRISRWGEPI